MNEKDEGVVRITLRDVYNSVESVRADVASVVKAVPDHEQRLRRLERWAYALPPTVVIAIASLLRK